MIDKNPEDIHLDPLARLKPIDRKLWIEYVNNGFIKINAFAAVNPLAKKGVAAGKDKHNFKTSCTYAFKRIMSVMTQEELLEAHGLGKDRIMTELNKRLTANTDKYFQDQHIATLEDNQTRMKATELLTRIHGMDKQVIVDESKAKISVYIPDNKRDTQETVKPPSIRFSSGTSDDFVKMFEELNPGITIAFEDAPNEE